LVKKVFNVDTVFLDRDGVVNRKAPEGDYIKHWGEFEFLPGAKEALRFLTEANKRLIIVTNQRGISLGLMTESDLREIHKRMLEEINAAGAVIDAIYYCPHDKGQCDCRKPDIGLFLKAKMDFPDIDFSSSVVIGDSFNDIEAGNRLECKTILIADVLHQSSYITRARIKEPTLFMVASSLVEAVICYLLPSIDGH
jgi:D-glycero-D-manno-heptose 1,7-bisphosphate phosphatase